MDIFLIILAALAVAHFVYDGIVRPTLMLNVRHELFSLRDQLRDPEVARAASCPPAAFEVVHSGINNLIGRLDLLTLSLPLQVKAALDADPAIRERAEARAQTVDQSECQPLKAIRDKAISRIEGAVLINAGGWFLYFVPLLALWFLLKQLAAPVRVWLTLQDKDAKRVIRQRFA